MIYHEMVNVSPIIGFSPWTYPTRIIFEQIKTSNGVNLSNLRITEIKAFVPSKNFELSKQFYQDLGFTMDSEDDGIAYFHFENVSFLLQDYFVTALAENFMMHILVEDVDAWWEQVRASGVVEKYGVRITPIELQPWQMRDFCLFDPSGVLWRIGQNV